MPKLFMLGVPIGNIKDITIRALETLQKSQIIIAEDTRNSKKLLSLLKIPIDDKKFLSLHKYKWEKTLNILSSKTEFLNKDLVYHTDAGTPGLSDPGAYLIEWAKQNRYQIIPIPGVSAITTLYSVSGIKEKGFYFIGFLPHKKYQVQSLFESLLNCVNVFIFFTSPIRVKRDLEILSYFLEKNNLKAKIVIGRELTKLYETIDYISSKELTEYIFSKNLKEKGEYTVIVSIKRTRTFTKSFGDNLKPPVVPRNNIKLLKELLANYLGISKSEAYKVIQNLKSTNKK